MPSLDSRSGKSFDNVDYDIIVIGAGVSGINTAYRIQQEFPQKTYTILEGREQMGGTWDLFKYPGIRSDSDLHTFGFPWRPWVSNNAIADGESILEYMRESAAEYGIDKKIQYGHRLEEANWSTPYKSWTLSVTAGQEKISMSCRWIIYGTGYYDYKTPLPTVIPGIENFEGKVIHPQFWPTDYDYSNKNIVIIGSGATAITLLPSLAPKAAHVTMLQRSPSYVHPVAQPDSQDLWMRKWLPQSISTKLIRAKWVIIPLILFKIIRWFPGHARKTLLANARKLLPAHIPLDPHFTPRYNPWDQRLCFSPNGDFYDAFKTNKADVVTGVIESVTKDSIYLKDSYQVLKPDVIVTATGLKIQALGGSRMLLDGREINVSDQHLWRGCLIEGVPNAATIIGYTAASWTLGADAIATVITRVMRRMEHQSLTEVVPTVSRKMEDEASFHLTSTYLAQGKNLLPKAGDRGPWRSKQYYLVDYWTSKYGSITDDLVYS